MVVLMINLAALLLARAAQREREFAISRALGANRLALARATLLEGGLLGTTLLSNAAVRGGGGHGRLRKGLVVVQVALSLVLLSAGGLVVRSFEGLLRAEPGFQTAAVLTMRVPIPAQGYPDAASIRSLHQRIEDELAALPGVVAVGATTGLPLSAAPKDMPLADRIRIRPGYFDALGIGVFAGRNFDRAPPEGAREAIIDRTLAATFFPTGNPVGATMVFGDDSLTVIGVVEHARMYDIQQDGRVQVYLHNEAPIHRTSRTLF
ncbi:MAG TPA: ABC transporter permease [Longimicrobiaceae bacterium]|nr:ABC transporter permease [Longimicrobiaceae bacterium]